MLDIEKLGIYGVFKRFFYDFMYESDVWYSRVLLFYVYDGIKGNLYSKW